MVNFSTTFFIVMQFDEIHPLALKYDRPFDSVLNSQMVGTTMQPLIHLTPLHRLKITRNTYFRKV